MILFVGLVLTVALWFYTREMGNLGRFFADAFGAVAGAVDCFKR